MAVSPLGFCRFILTSSRLRHRYVFELMMVETERSEPPLSNLNDMKLKISSRTVLVRMFAENFLRNHLL